MTREVRLTPVDEQNLEPLLSVAVAETEPDEVMPPVEAPAGWSQARRDAFREFHRANFGGLDGPTGNLMYAIVQDGDVVGMARLGRHAEPGTLETGMWLGKSTRGQGIGLIALRLLLAEAVEAGARRVVAETRADNIPALNLLARCGAVLGGDGTAIRAEIRLGVNEDVSAPGEARAAGGTG
ncbi:GNAT family protein [Plantactinospora sp. KLBMP9567]|uniref:GNAT family N-acetyltransferase n=1 Tax=Plantactinospora sp. KLBMP9567 TaxID=3085900 RepID=UPI0029820A52|nr:GNAT family protein [Plantactinospora sp. KLBMP9567]MDW5325413.1 GNAT family protein [Plantactinospora sp. KLBMP9567]